MEKALIAKTSKEKVEQDMKKIKQDIKDIKINQLSIAEKLDKILNAAIPFENRRGSTKY